MGLTLNLFLGMVVLFIAAFTFDISFNLRRLNQNVDRLWRKISEIETLIRDKKEPL